MSSQQGERSKRMARHAGERLTIEVRLSHDLESSLRVIRRLVYDMRPPALDEMGLVPALRQQVATLQTAQGDPMRVRVEACDLPALPAAVEVAAFRIATEAVINSARHSGTDQAWVQIQQHDGRLEVSVRDSGTTVGSWVPGVGLSSMRDLRLVN